MSTALAIMAHPDDAEVLAGGLLSFWVEEGYEIYFVICTDGGSGGVWSAQDVGEKARKHIIETRKIEQDVAGSILGVKGVTYLDYPDGLLEPSLELRKDIVTAIRLYRPERIICPSSELNWNTAFLFNHPDHLACGKAVLSAFYPSSGNAWDFPDLLEEGLKPHTVAELYIANAPFPNWYFHLSEERMKQKESAIMAHLSQFEQKPEFVNQVTTCYAEEYHKVVRWE